MEVVSLGVSFASLLLILVVYTATKRTEESLKGLTRLLRHEELIKVSHTLPQEEPTAPIPKPKTQTPRTRRNKTER